MKNKLLFRDTDRLQHTLPVYYRSWWLDLVYGHNNWNYITDVNSDGFIIGILPVSVKSKRGFQRITMPSDSHYGGPFIIYDKPRKPDSLVSYENKVIENLLNKLPSVSFIYFQLLPNIHSLLVFRWKKYAVSISYTYTIKLENLISDLEWKLKPSARNHIRKCKASGYEFENCTDISMFCDVLVTSFNNRNKDLPYNIGFLRKAIQTALDNNQGKIFIVKNTEKRNVAGIFCLYDHERVYYYCGTNINDQSQSGALTYCLWEAMIYFKSAGLKTFDFEGSDIKPVEHFFRSFGGELTPIYRVFWCKNIFIRMLAYFQNSNIFG